MSISYLVLHYNRPYLLECNIKLIRKYIPSAQIVVADDGSDKEIVKRISKFEIDELFVQTSNQNTWGDGTCSTTLKSARKLCKNEYLLFSEDDFFYCAQPVENYEPKPDEIMPPVYFPQHNTIDYIAEAQNILAEHPRIKNVQLARDGRRVKTADDFISPNYTWKHIDHAKKKVCYYCNWPSLLRKNDYFQVKIHSGMSIWKFESYFSKAVAEAFGSGNWALVPEKRLFVHVGMAFSKRLNSFVYSQKRSKFGCDIQMKTFKKVVKQDVESFNKLLLKHYINGTFHIDFSEMINNGLNEAFVSAFERMSKHV